MHEFGQPWYESNYTVCVRGVWRFYQVPPTWIKEFVFCRRFEGPPVLIHPNDDTKQKPQLVTIVSSVSFHSLEESVNFQITYNKRPLLTDPYHSHSAWQVYWFSTVGVLSSHPYWTVMEVKEVTVLLNLVENTVLVWTVIKRGEITLSQTSLGAAREEKHKNKVHTTILHVTA